MGIAKKIVSTKSDVAKAVTGEIFAIAKDSPETKVAAKNIASSLSIVTGTVKRVLFPLALINFGYDKAEKYFKERFESDITEITKNISAEDLIEPKPSLAGPAIQGLAYSHDEKELRDMYLNLLASSMNKVTSDNAHPAYVETIKQLTSNEAELLKLFLMNKNIAIAQVKLIVNSKKEYQIVDKHIVDLIDTDTGNPKINKMFQAYVDNWIRLGLVEVQYGIYLTGENAYDWVTKRPEYLALKPKKVMENEYQPVLEVERGIITRTKYGEIFGKIVGIS